MTFDNFDDTSMVSMDGWQWSTAARALDINEKCVKVNYGKGGCQYDSEGTARNINVAMTGVAARQIEQPLYPPDPNLLPGNANEVEADGPNGEEGTGYLWDAALKAHLTVRNYGFYTDLGAFDVREALATQSHSHRSLLREASCPGCVAGEEGTAQPHAISASGPSTRASPTSSAMRNGRGNSTSRLSPIRSPI